MFTKKIFLLFILVYFSNCIAVSAQTLQGTISLEVGKKTKPLDPLLWAGNYFDEKVATALLKDESVNTSIWKKIPAWQAGEWESTQATCTKAVKYINGQQHAVAAVGCYTCKGRESSVLQKDRNGDVWSWYSSGYWTRTEYKDDIGHSFKKFTAPGPAEYPDLYAESIDFHVDKSTNKITYVYQSKSWTRYVYLSPGLCKKDEVRTTFDEKGEPSVSAWNTLLYKRIGTFAEIEMLIATDTEVQEQIRQDFFNYLKNNGMANLIPANKNDVSNKGKMAGGKLATKQ